MQKDYAKKLFEMVGAGKLSEAEAINLIHRLSHIETEAPDLRESRPLSAVAIGTSKERFLDFILNILSKLTPQKIDRSSFTKSIINLEFTSLDLTSFATSLNSTFKVKLTPTMLFEFSNIDQFLSYIYENNWKNIENFFVNGNPNPGEPSEMQPPELDKGIQLENNDKPTDQKSPFKSWWESLDSSSTPSNPAKTSISSTDPGLRTIHIERAGIISEFFTVGIGPVILVLGGLGSKLSQWDFLINRFQSSNRLVFYSLPGHGASSLSSKFKSYQDIAEELATSLFEVSGGAPFNLIGYSLGGVLSQQMALSYPHVIKSLTIISSLCLGRPHLASLDGFSKEIKKLEFRLHDQVIGLDTGLPTQVLEMYRKLQLNQNDSKTIVDSNFTGSNLFGSSDDYINPAWSQEIQNRFPSLKLISVPNGGHFLPQTHPDEICKALTEVLS